MLWRAAQQNSDPLEREIVQTNVRPMKQRVPWLRMLAEGVVILTSILLAFGVDAWWAERQRIGDEAELLAGLHQEVTDNVVTLRAGLDWLEVNRDRLSRFVSSDPASLGESVSDSTWHTVIRPQYRGDRPILSYGFLDATIAAGKLELIRDVELRAALAGLKRLQVEADGPGGPGAGLADLGLQAAALLGIEREVQLGYTDAVSQSPISAATVQALRSEEQIVALAATRSMMTTGYVEQLRDLEAELVRILSLLEAG